MPADGWEPGACLQQWPRPGVIELGWGQPDPDGLPAGIVASAATAMLEAAGAAALGYGRNEGPGMLEAWMCARAGALGIRLEPGELFVAAGASAALDRVCAAFTAPGDTVLVEDLTYDLARRILTDRGLHLTPVRTDEDGIVPEALAAAISDAGRGGARPRFLYTIPTFGNPTGALLPAGRRVEVAAVCADAGILIVEDDVYRELWLDEPPPSAIRTHAPDHVITIGSASKAIAPGLRVGWAAAAAPVIDRLRCAGVAESGGGEAHFTAMVLAQMGTSGAYDEIVERRREAHRHRRAALLGALEATMPRDVRWTRPSGGFFVWVELPERLARDSGSLLAAAVAGGVSFLPGGPFAVGHRVDALRLSLSRYGPRQLEEGVARLAGVMGRAGATSRSPRSGRSGPAFAG